MKYMPRMELRGFWNYSTSIGFIYPDVDNSEEQSLVIKLAFDRVYLALLHRNKVVFLRLVL